MPRYRIIPRVQGRHNVVELAVERRVLFFWKRMRVFVLQSSAERYIAELTAPVVNYDQHGKRV